MLVVLENGSRHSLVGEDCSHQAHLSLLAITKSTPEVYSPGAPPWLTHQAHPHGSHHVIPARIAGGTNQAVAYGGLKRASALRLKWASCIPGAIFGTVSTPSCV